MPCAFCCVSSHRQQTLSGDAKCWSGRCAARLRLFSLGTGRLSQGVLSPQVSSCALVIVFFKPHFDENFIHYNFITFNFGKVCLIKPINTPGDEL